MSIDRLVIEWHQCENQEQLNAFWARVPEPLHEQLIERMHELFPPDPNECQTDPYSLRTRLLGRGLEEWEATMMGRAAAHACTEREGRTEPCVRCERYQLDHPSPYT
jgi:hypothetical protein